MKKKGPVNAVGTALCAYLLMTSHFAAAQSEDIIKGAFVMCLQGAVVACDDLVKMPDLSATVRANAYDTRAGTLMQLGRFAEAKSDLDEAFRLDPSNQTVARLRTLLSGMVQQNGATVALMGCESSGDPTARLQSCSALIDATKGNPVGQASAYDLRAGVFLDLGKSSEALGDLDAADRLAPHREGAALHRVTVLTASGDYSKALTLASSAIGAASFADPRLLQMKAELLYLTGDRRAAVDAYEKASQASPGAIKPRFWKAIIRMELHEDAADDLRPLLTNPMMTVFGAAIVHLHLHDGSAEAVMREVPVSGPDAPCIAYFNIGHEAWLRGDAAGARKALQAAVDTDRRLLAEYRAAKLILQQLPL
jgi:tetratricopeptide (TPR) repeat protein